MVKFIDTAKDIGTRIYEIISASKIEKDQVTELEDAFHELNSIKHKRDSFYNKQLAGTDICPLAKIKNATTTSTPPFKLC